ncbi:formate-dependent uric acid utilization protein YgfT [Escherichia marmotae]|uniref:formate-dependent uric acid utilization protein YgfT n=1 Tax=Escherichia marmotae TaxID=1499973 RepID=UPI002814246C|nr:formate-dependent uric acid utilization protein YgfT [Escherichia marmotae]MDQ9241185.1 formate-dependent uric acid utilization protein YgfT [Escherichia marmotae]MDQ9273809.1 formate-dependent uric acid utilization protein YgfT [Escherichia marmotae]MED9399187.1 formate-dependent uric acid utilization protein YgfT [Escherichia marmotae]MED9484128.1 formate-dependent uric acid utilization protein YgfT [Escherichia marmotae]
MNKFIAADAAECIGCHACEIACAVAHNQELWPLSHRDFRPRIHVVGKGLAANPVACHHCNNAPCVTACPVNALTFQPDSVQLDEQKCIGCKRCAIACPFGVIEMADTIAQKCDLCNQRSSGTQACIESCPTQALRLMDDKGLQQIKMTRQRKTAQGKASEGTPPSRHAALLPVNPRKGADKIPANERKKHFGEIYCGLDHQQAAYESERCVYCAGKANCNWFCPLHNAIPDYVHLVQEGKIIEAAELCHQTSSLPEICGRVCPQDRLCEGACTLKDHSGTVSIGNLERYITDTALAMGWRPDVSLVAPRVEKVAVIGAGPAGLGCADILARAGVHVDVFDRHPEIGGMLTFGIPPFKLDKRVLSQRREIFTAMGIDFHLNCEIGRDISFNELTVEYDAVFLGVGTYGMMRADLPHEDAPGVIQALPFLTAHTRQLMGLPESGEYPLTEVEGKRVVVLGGGDTTMDCLRTSIRLNAASVTCAYRRDEVSMPGSRKEVVNAREEGVEFQFNVQPQYIACDDDGRLTAVGLIRTAMGEPGPDGRRRPRPVAGSEFELPADVLIMAFGFQAHAMPWLQGSGIKLDKWGLIKTGDAGYLSTQTHLKKVFAGGDAVHGADLVVTAMAAGRQAARDMLTLFDTKVS